MTNTITEAQDYNSIGELAPEGEATLTHQKGFDGVAGDAPPSEPGIEQLQGHDFSRWNARANRQTRGQDPDGSFAEHFFDPAGSIPPRAGYGAGEGYTEIPTAATDPEPFQSAPDGTIPGATK